MTKYIFANWKENKNLEEALGEVRQLRRLLVGKNLFQKKLVLLPPAVFLVPLLKEVRKFDPPVELGAQDISLFREGAHTGEIAARMVRGIATYALLGHSERRKSFNETSEVVNQKIKICQEFHLIPLVCLGSPKELEELRFDSRIDPVFICYEDPSFIGRGEVKKVEEIISFVRKARERFPGSPFRFIYGGSVDEKNAGALLAEDRIDGLLVGHTSLAASRLEQILRL